ncbi:MAG: putative amidohydrolase [Glaciecola sp.]|jgi:predicted amidohydrolase
MKHFSIAGIQMHVEASNGNVALMKHKLEVLMSVYPWVQMVVYSELCPFGPLMYYAQPFPNETEQLFQELAKKYQIWLIPGSMFQKRGGNIYNTASVIDPNGAVVGRYDKMFPFLPYEEGVTGGSDFLIWDVPDVGRFGLSICYDMWFPETSRTLAVQGVEVIIHPTFTGSIDRDIELSIAQATAAINQCFIFDINGLGEGGTGRSIVCGPDGRVLYQAGTGPELIPIEVDIERVRRSRENGVLRLGQPLKSFRDRNVDFDIYDKGKAHPYMESLGALQKPTRMEDLLKIHHVMPEIVPPAGLPGSPS